MFADCLHQLRFADVEIIEKAQVTLVAVGIELFLFIEEGRHHAKLLNHLVVAGGNTEFLCLAHQDETLRGLDVELVLKFKGVGRLMAAAEHDLRHHSVLGGLKISRVYGLALDGGKIFILFSAKDRAGGGEQKPHPHADHEDNSQNQRSVFPNHALHANKHILYSLVKLGENTRTLHHRQTPKSLLD